MMRTPFMFQQKLKLAVKKGSGERAFPMHMLFQILSVWEVCLSRPKVLGDHFVSLRNTSVSPHLLGTGS